MSTLFDIFGTDGATSVKYSYLLIGYPRNPFRELSSGQSAITRPFYTRHITDELIEVNRWRQDVINETNLQPLSLVGNIGAGKSRILQVLRHVLISQTRDQKLYCEHVELSNTGYARASV